MDKNIIQVKDLSFNHPNQPLLFKNINLSIAQQDRVAIMGSSGSGKTTLISLMAGLLPIQSGSIKIMNTLLETASESEKNTLRRENIGFVFQDFKLIPSLTVLENIMLSIDIKGGEKAKESSIKWATSLNLQHRLNHYPDQLSGGEQQRTAIARAMVKSPEVIFADEPTGNLDDNQSFMLVDTLLDTIKNQDTSLVLVTHDHRIADKLCSRKINLMSGQLQTVN
ncbi:MAG TPA: ABC transporter ATP-binding protein [Gammaproteobacteria bacterium]|nr:ABC transporter ATP-binding protein [Gammaproteobacteria bacterium]